LGDVLKWWDRRISKRLDWQSEKDKYRTLMLKADYESLMLSLVPSTVVTPYMNERRLEVLNAVKSIPSIAPSLVAKDATTVLRLLDEHVRQICKHLETAWTQSLE
jgi:hypothetical protein